MFTVKSFLKLFEVTPKKSKVEESVYSKLGGLCTQYPYNNVLTDQMLSVEYYYENLGLALIRDCLSNERYISELITVKNNSSIEEPTQDLDIKSGYLVLKVDITFKLKRVSRIVSVYKHYTDPCIYSEFLGMIARSKRNTRTIA